MIVAIAFLVGSADPLRLRSSERSPFPDVVGYSPCAEGTLGGNLDPGGREFLLAALFISIATGIEDFLLAILPIISFTLITGCPFGPVVADALAVIGAGGGRSRGEGEPIALRPKMGTTVAAFSPIPGVSSLGEKVVDVLWGESGFFEDGSGIPVLRETNVVAFFCEAFRLIGFMVPLSITTEGI